MKTDPLPVHLRDCADQGEHDGTFCRCPCHPTRAAWSVTIEGSPAGINEAYKIRYYGGRCPACGRGKAGLAKTDTVETWQLAVAWKVKAARPRGWVPGRRVIIEIEFFMGRKGRDADGPLKPLLDGIAEGLG